MASTYSQGPTEPAPSSAGAPELDGQAPQSARVATAAESRDPGSRDLPLSQDARSKERARTGGRLATIVGVQVAATGSYVPDEIVANEDLTALGCDPDWIVQRTGILQRRRASPGQATSDLAYEAARQCLTQAGVSARDVDMVIVATMTPDMPSPSAACLLQQRLGAPAPAMDINAACAGFMYALITGMQFVHSGCHRRVLVVGADVMTRLMDPEDKRTYPLFGDGAGAVLLAPGSRSQGLLGYCLGADGGGADLLCVRGGGSRKPATAESVADGHHFLRMEGRAVFKWAVRMISDSASEVLAHCRMSPDEVDYVILHQANMRIIDAASSNLRLPRDRVVVNVDRYGNTAGGSVPLALDEVHRDGLLKSGNRILMSGFGAGLAWGTAVLAW